MTADARLYEDEQCCYFGGDLRFETRQDDGVLALTNGAIVFRGKEGPMTWPRRDIKSVSYAPTHPVDCGDLLRTYGQDAAQDISLAMADLTPEPALRIVVTDPDGVEESGFDIRILFRSEYYAKVFGKRVEKVFGLPFGTVAE